MPEIKVKTDLKIDTPKTNRELMTFYIMLTLNFLSFSLSSLLIVKNYHQFRRINLLERMKSRFILSLDDYREDLNKSLSRIKSLEQEKLVLIQRLTNLGVNPFDEQIDSDNEEDNRQTNFLQ